LSGPDLVRGVVEEEADENGDVDLDVAPPRRRVRFAPIEERLTKGEELLVQVSKEPIGSKGARVTANISLPGRFLVHMPGTNHVGISRRIEDGEERDRLRDAVESERTGVDGFIVRTACEGATKREIRDDVRFLTRLWAHVQQTAAGAAAPALVHRDLDLALRVLRDLFTSDVERLVVDDPAEHARIREFVEALMPRLASRVHCYEGATPLFEQHGVETKIARALERRVWLKSGGYLIFDQTESLTTVDVNTGRYVGKKDQEETVLKTNLEAAKQVVHQLRLRNIGGIIVIDFIDMEKLSNRRKVYDALQESIRADKARSTVLQISELGLVQMTRKRTRESLGQLLREPCPHCDSRRLASAETVATYLRRASTPRAAPGIGDLVIRIHAKCAFSA
jgi:ribonuclease G